MTAQPFTQFVKLNAIAWVLILLTWLLYERVEHYRDVSGEMLHNASFEFGLTGWRASSNVSGDEYGSIDLSNREQKEGHYIHQSLNKPQSGIVRVSADARIRNVVRGAEVWQKARVGVFAREPGGVWSWEFPSTLFAETGTIDIQNISAVFHIPEKYSEVRVEAELVGGTGVFLVERLSLKEVAPRLMIRLTTFVLLGFWILAAFFMLWQLVKSGLWQPCIVLFLISGALLLMPESAKVQMLEFFAHYVSDVLLRFSPEHFLLYFIASIVVLFHTGHRKINTAHVIVSLFTFSIASEILQYYTTHRNPSLMDGFINVLGIFAALMVYWSFTGLRKRRRVV